MKKIHITGDLIRVNPQGVPNQVSNIQWLYNLVSWQIRNVAADSQLSCLLPQVAGNGFDAGDFFARCTMENCEESWIQLYDRAEIPETALEYFSETFSGSLVIGYELPDLFINLFKQLEITYLDFAIHPLRYLDDIFLGVRTNCPDMFSRLVPRAMPVELYSVYAGLCKATICRMPDRPKLRSNSCLFVGQTEVDRSLIKNGQLLKLAEFADRIRALGEEFAIVYYKPHPYARNKRALFDLFPDRQIELIDENIYRLLCCPEIEQIYTISSSVCLEARYFEKNAKAFFPDNLSRFDFTRGNPDPDSYVPLWDDFLYPLFWADILQPHFPTSCAVDFQLPRKTSRLRTALGCYWGYNSLDTGILLRDIAPGLLEQNPHAAERGTWSLIRSLFKRG